MAAAIHHALSSVKRTLAVILLLCLPATASAGDWQTTPAWAQNHTRLVSQALASVKVGCADATTYAGYGAAQDVYTTCTGAAQYNESYDWCVANPQMASYFTGGCHDLWLDKGPWLDVYFTASDVSLFMGHDAILNTSFYGGTPIPPPGSYSLSLVRCKGDPYGGRSGGQFHQLICGARLGPGHDIHWQGDGGWSIKYKYIQTGRSSYKVEGIEFYLNGQPWDSWSDYGDGSTSGSGGSTFVCCKTVYVHGYTRADGTVVGAYTRRAPGTAIG